MYCDNNGIYGEGRVIFCTLKTRLVCIFLLLCQCWVQNFCVNIVLAFQMQFQIPHFAYSLHSFIMDSSQGQLEGKMDWVREYVLLC